MRNGRSLQDRHPGEVNFARRNITGGWHDRKSRLDHRRRVHVRHHDDRVQRRHHALRFQPAILLGVRPDFDVPDGGCVLPGAFGSLYQPRACQRRYPAAEIFTRDDPPVGNRHLPRRHSSVLPDRLSRFPARRRQLPIGRRHGGRNPLADVAIDRPRAIRSRVDHAASGASFGRSRPFTHHRAGRDRPAGIARRWRNLRMILTLAMIVLFVLLAIGTPVGFAMAGSGVLGLYLVGGMPMLSGILQTAPLSAVTSYELITIPMFLLMAEFVLVSGIADDLFKATAAWVGRIPGGLGMATALAGAGFGAICGTSTASAATLSATSLPAMLKQGYEPKMAAGVVAISGTLAMLIPPSVALVIYGLLAEVNIGALLIGGIIPGILVTITIMATVWFLAWQDPSRAPSAPAVSLIEKFQMLRVVGPMLLLFGMVTGVIYTGVATPTEASALGAFGSFSLAGWKGKINWQSLRSALLRSAHGTCMIAMILFGASIFGYFFTLTQVTQNLVAWVGGLPVPPWVILTIILFGYIVLGSFMDQIAILVLTVP